MVKGFFEQLGCQTARVYDVGNAHAANEYFVIEGAGKVYGIAGAEKAAAMIIYNFAGKNGPPSEATKTAQRQ